MRKIINLTESEKKYLEEVVKNAERVAGMKLCRARKNIILSKAFDQILALRYAALHQSGHEKLTGTGEFVWNKKTPFRR